MRTPTVYMVNSDSPVRLSIHGQVAQILLIMVKHLTINQSNNDLLTAYIQLSNCDNIRILETKLMIMRIIYRR